MGSVQASVRVSGATGSAAKKAAASSGVALVGGVTRSVWRRALLATSLHADAFRVDPRAYIQALAWRIRGFRVRSRSRFLMLASRSPHAYDLWIARNEPELLANAAAECGGIEGAPSIIPVIDCRWSNGGLEETLASVALAGTKAIPVLLGGPVVRGTIQVDGLSELAKNLPTDEAWLCTLRPGDRLAVGALKIYAGRVAGMEGARLLYADDDLIISGRKRRSPHFKPEWNPDLFVHHDFISGSAVVLASRSDISQARSDSWPKSLVDTVLDQAPPVHLPLVLHHRRDRSPPIVPDKPSRLVEDSVLSVTAIVPSRNHVALLRNCIEGLRRTEYPALDIIVVDNGSDDAETLEYLHSLEDEGVTVLREPGPFNYSALNNKAVAIARGELLCFLNNDVEMLDSDWLAMMVLQAMRPEIGAVGARLLYPDGTIQHAGVFVGIGGAAGHAHRLQSAEESGYFDRARLPQRVSAVTAACLVVTRQKFLAVGGFDEATFPIAFNDVDLCLKLNSRGWASFYEPRATLIHHESKSRGSDYDKANRVRFAGELGALKRKWRTEVTRDPYHHPHLSRISERFLIAI